MQRYTWYVGITLFILAIFGCSDDPNVLGLPGSGLISGEDTLKIDSRSITGNSDTTFLLRISGTSSTLIGKYEDTEVRSLMQFTGLASIPANARIDSAIITFAVNYKLKNATGTLACSVHEMLRSWSESSFLWDSVTAPNTYLSNPDTTYSKNIGLEDSVISIRVDPLVRKWVVASTDIPNGLILIPDLVGSTIIVGSRSVLGLETRPLLTISYHDSLDSAKVYSIRSQQRTFLANSSSPTPAGKISVQAGIGFRGLIRFDSLSIPQKASITQAILEIALDSSASILSSSSRDTILAYLLRKNTLPYDSLVLGTICTPITEHGQKKYRANIKSIIQQWVVREPNLGIVIRPLGEFSTVDRFVLHGSSATEGLRPRLIITYTVLP